MWASEYFGIIDFVFNVLPGVVPALMLRAHFAVLMLFTALRMWQTVQSHSGYDLPYDPFNRGVFHGGGGGMTSTTRTTTGAMPISCPFGTGSAGRTRRTMPSGTNTRV